MDAKYFLLDDGDDLEVNVVNNFSLGRTGTAVYTESQVSQIKHELHLLKEQITKIASAAGIVEEGTAIEGPALLVIGDDIVSELNSTTLARKHSDELSFELRLKFTNTDSLNVKYKEAWAGRLGPVRDPSEADYFSSFAAGETLEFVYNWLIEEAGMEWLRSVKLEDLVIDSSPGE